MERPKDEELLILLEDGNISIFVVEIFSRLGRNIGDVIRIFEWQEDHKIYVHV